MGRVFAPSCPRAYARRTCSASPWARAGSNSALLSISHTPPVAGLAWRSRTSRTMGAVQPVWWGLRSFRRFRCGGIQPENRSATTDFEEIAQSIFNLVWRIPQSEKSEKSAVKTHGDIQATSESGLMEEPQVPSVRRIDAVVDGAEAGSVCGRVPAGDFQIWIRRFWKRGETRKATKLRWPPGRSGS